jgi:XisH protein
MPALDTCHEQVVHALENDGWTVSPDMFVLRLDRQHRFYIDLEAIGFDNQTIMVIEVKCFENPAAETTELYGAIGQYLVYRNLLREHGIQLPLYLAVPLHAYAGVISRMALSVMAQNDVKMIVIDIEREAVIQWLS